ncbi:hypothetical protein GCM10008944_02780 [Cytobacillus oceanisediminis]
MNALDRRTLLLGSAGLLVASCSSGGSSPGTEATKGPKIHRPNAGNAVTQDDVAALRDQLNTAFGTGDVEKLLQVIKGDDYSLDDVRARWSRRFENFGRLGFIDGEWYVGVPGGRTRNGAGGIVEYDGDLVFAHQVRGADGQQVVETYRASFRKADEKSPLELLRIGEPEESYDPSFWDVADIDAIETKHTYLAFRSKDAATAKRISGTIEAGAKRAFDLMPRPKGVDKIFYALTWPKIDGKLWGGVAVGDADAHAYYHPFLDPEELAKGQKKTTSAKGLPKGTGRVGMHQSSLTRSDFEGVACHEAVHVLANQWITPGAKATWAAEGLATWADNGTSGLLGRDGGRIRGHFGRFVDIAAKGAEGFYDKNQEVRYNNYVSAAAVFAYLESERGRSSVFDQAEYYYGNAGQEGYEGKLDGRTRDLFDDTRKWLNA